MKTKLKTTLLLAILFIGKALNAQTLAVADFNTTGVHATPKIVAKLARLELVKTNKFGGN